MALQSGLAIWCYTPPGASFYGATAREYSQVCESIRWTTLQPGGFGQLTATFKVGDARIPRPELALFSRVAVVGHGEDGTYWVFVGEIIAPELSLDAQNGEFWNIQALGIGNCVRDDPQNVTYSAQTPQQMIKNQMTLDNRATWMPIDSDQSQIFPDNPAATFSPSYMGNTMEYVLGDVCILAGDYGWGVWAHPTHRDAFGHATGQLVVHLRDSSTVRYQARLSSGDVIGMKLSASADRAYNAITLAYNDPANNGYGTTTAIDGRLGGTFAQQTAPFRFRRYWQDYSGTTTVGKTQAQNISTTFVSQMKNVTNKIQVTLQAVRNFAGVLIPLWSVMADKNILIPELAPRGYQLANVPTAGVNLFYIYQTEYSEDSSGNQQLVLQLDSFYDYSQVLLARLQLQAYNALRNGTTAARVQAIGAPDVGRAGKQDFTSSAAQTVGIGVNYHAVMAQAPTSITLTAITTTNAATIAASSITVYGFFLSWVATLAGNTKYDTTWQTVGNCLLAVDPVGGTFDHHCEACGAVHTAVPMVGNILVSNPTGLATPGSVALTYTCPSCGAVECFNSGLTASDGQVSTDNPPTRANLAYLILQLMASPQLAPLIVAAGGPNPPPPPPPPPPAVGVKL